MWEASDFSNSRLVKVILILYRTAQWPVKIYMWEADDFGRKSPQILVKASGENYIIYVIARQLSPVILVRRYEISRVKTCFHESNLPTLLSLPGRACSTSPGWVMRKFLPGWATADTHVTCG